MKLKGTMMPRTYSSTEVAASRPVKKNGVQIKMPHPTIWVSCPMPLTRGSCGVSMSVVFFMAVKIPVLFKTNRFDGV